MDNFDYELYINGISQGKIVNLYDIDRWMTTVREIFEPDEIIFSFGGIGFCSDSSSRWTNKSVNIIIDHEVVI